MQRGITIIEILLVGLIILLVIGGDIFVSLYEGQKTRDIITLSEVSQIRSGLEVFLSLNNFYPKTVQSTALNDSYVGTQKLCADGFKRESDPCAKTIENPIPNFYQSLGNSYTYKGATDGQNYQIEFFLYTNFPQLGLKSGKNCATNTNITSRACL